MTLQRGWRLGRPLGFQGRFPRLPWGLAFPLNPEQAAGAPWAPRVPIPLPPPSTRCLLLSLLLHVSCCKATEVLMALPLLGPLLSSASSFLAALLSSLTTGLACLALEVVPVHLLEVLATGDPFASPACS